MKKMILSALLTAALITMSACSSLVRIEYKDNYFVDSAHNIQYDMASVSYEPVSVGAEYAQCGKTLLYEIPGADPTQWLTEAYEGIGSVFYSTEIALPTLAEMKPNNVQICVTNVKTISIGSITEQADIDAVVDALTNGESVMMPPNGTSFDLKFLSETYPFLQYSVVYIKCADGGRYLYDRGARKTVKAGDLLERYLPDDQAAAESILEDLESNMPEVDMAQ